MLGTPLTTDGFFYLVCPWVQSDREIAGCISDTGMHFQPEDLLKPNPQQIQKVFEWFANLLMNITRETVDPAMRAATEDVCGEYGEVVPVDTRNLMGFYVAVRRLLLEVRELWSDSDAGKRGRGLTIKDERGRG